eukprot:158440_1
MQPSNIAGTDVLRVRLSHESPHFLRIDQLSDACSRGHPSSVISKIITGIKSTHTPTKHEPKPIISSTDSFGRTALHYAAMKGRESVINLLLDNDFDANHDDMHGSYPLHLAIQSHHYDAAIALCKASRPNLVNYKRESAILLLSKSRYHPKMKLLLSELINHGNDVDLMDSRQCNPLFFAVDKPSLLRQLLTFGCDVNHTDGFGRNALFNAVYAANVEAAKLLLTAGSKIEIRDDFDHTPLMLAACFGGYEIADLLIKRGADVNAMMKSQFWFMSPLSLAIKHTNYDVAKLLVQSGAALDREVFHDQMIWDLCMEQKYDFECKDEEDDDVDMNEPVLAPMSDDMDLEIYSLGECAKLNSNPRGHSSLTMEETDTNRKRRTLLAFMERTETQRKMNSLINTELVQTLKI